MSFLDSLKKKAATPTPPAVKEETTVATAPPPAKEEAKQPTKEERKAANKAKAEAAKAAARQAKAAEATPPTPEKIEFVETETYDAFVVADHGKLYRGIVPFGKDFRWVEIPKHNFRPGSPALGLGAKVRGHVVQSTDRKNRDGQPWNRMTFCEVLAEETQVSKIMETIEKMSVDMKVQTTGFAHTVAMAICEGGEVDLETALKVVFQGNSILSIDKNTGTIFTTKDK